MHEMPFTQALLEMALKAAGGRLIQRIHLRVGWLSAIVPESVECYFSLLSRDTTAHGAELVFEMYPIELTCRHCGKVTRLHPDESISPRQALATAFRSGCPCGKGQWTVTSGLDFELSHVEVMEASPR